MRVIRILVSIVLMLISITFSVGLILLIIKDVEFNKIPFLCIICYTALCGLSLGLLSFVAWGNETEKAKILSNDFKDITKMIIPEQDVKNKASQTSASSGKDYQICISCKQLETLENCFKSYANAIADI